MEIVSLNFNCLQTCDQSKIGLCIMFAGFGMGTGIFKTEVSK
jgi:hypothetical protein